MKKQYSKVNLFIRSSFFFVVCTAMISVYGLLCVAAVILPLRYRHALIRTFLVTIIFAFKKICLVDYKVIGLKNVPKDHAAVVLSKHQSTWETFYLPIVFHNPAVIVKRELLWIPFFGWGLAVGDPIAIDRNNRSSAMQQLITKGKKCLESGRFIVVFPEGTRVPTGEVGHYRLGGARLAVATGTPVIPVAHNAGRFWPRRKFIKQPGTIQVVIGPEIATVGKTADQVLQEAKTWIETTMLEIDSI